MRKIAKNVLIIGGGNRITAAKMLEENFEDVRVKSLKKTNKEQRK